MKIALSNHELEFIKTHVASPLKEFGAQIFVFGSRSTNTHSKFSDLDILVRIQGPSEKIKAKIAQINEKLIESSFPYKVDIVLENELADSYKINVLKQLIEI